MVEWTIRRLSRWVGEGRHGRERLRRTGERWNQTVLIGIEIAWTCCIELQVKQSALFLVIPLSMSESVSGGVEEEKTKAKSKTQGPLTGLF